MTTITLAPEDRPLRKDAELNRQRILDAARELFAQRGLGVTLNDIAHHAGVGVGTVYRRFPDKSQLIDDLFQQRLEDLVALMNDALADPDAWHGLTTFLARALELQAGDRGLRELITGMPDGLEPIARIRARMMPLAADLVRLARESGRLRSDIEATDLPIVQLIVGALIDATREEHPELWRRYLAIILRGLAADPDAEPALSPASATPAQVDRVMSYVKPARR